MPPSRLRHRRVNGSRDGLLIRAALDRIFPENEVALAIATITKWPGYAQTPLIELPDLSQAFGVARISYKDESGRFGLGSFKALGGAYAVARAHEQKMRIEGANFGGHADDVRSNDAVRSFTVISATAGNHGRSVAWGAQRLGCKCVILVHSGVSRERRDAIAEFGADLREVPGTYDDSVSEAYRLAEQNGWTVVSDTSRPGSEDIPALVMHGYAVMVDEAIRQWGDEPPTHVVVQVGVGGLAAAVLQGVWRRWGGDSPRFVCVEPEAADCFFRSVERGEMTKVDGDLDTMMVCLACGEMSSLAWEVLSVGATDAVRISDGSSAEAMRLLAGASGARPPVAAGESGAAGLAALAATVSDPSLASALDLTSESRVLLIGSEGALDAALYERITGRRPALVAA